MRNKTNTLNSLKIGLLSLMFILSSNAFAADSEYLENITLPECDATNPEVQFISSNTDWSKINDSSKSIFCVKPGDYRSAGKITLSADGSSAKRRYIVLDNGNDTHPAKLETSEQANVWLSFDNGGSYWVIDRISSLSVDTGSAEKLYRFYGGASNNILNRLHITDLKDHGIAFYHGCDNNTIQNSRIADMSLGGRQRDRVAILLSNSITDGSTTLNTKIINNEIVNACDAIQLTRADDGTYTNVNFAGTIIDNNLLWITPDIYTDEEHAWAENAIDLKAGSKDTANPVVITNNKMWGFRHNSSGSGQGKAVTIHFGVPNLVFENNYIMDSEWGISLSTSRDNDIPYPAMNALFKHNVFYKVNKTVDGDTPYVMFSYACNNIRIEENVWVGSLTGYAMRFENNSGDTTFKNNVLISSGQTAHVSGVLEASGNYYYDTSNGIKGTGDISYANASDAKMGDYTFNYDLFTNNPKQITLVGVVTTSLSPHANLAGIPDAPVSEEPVAEEPVAVEPVTVEPVTVEPTGPWIMDYQNKELK